MIGIPVVILFILIRQCLTILFLKLLIFIIWAALILSKTLQHTENYPQARIKVIY